MVPSTIRFAEPGAVLGFIYEYSAEKLKVFGRSNFGPELGPIARQKDSKFAFMLLSIPLKTYAFRAIPIAC